ncbi:unnamed protein product [Clonostachys rhizophaga]|uniref:Zn(2)-C6 fungal-type domain-containing protein n=1 Tax=Clonostachys rhizophaga TaxID=160324 RepID=A0A9N9YN92_9HYPO|nr:unnamed protein product [Clonostachys rhizophaga]
MPRAVKASNKSPKDCRSTQRGSSTCKTCTPCRAKKIKCDGRRPKCSDCEATALDCVYPRDARKELRPSRARVQVLEDTMAMMLEHMSSMGVVLPDSPALKGVGGTSEADLPSHNSPANASVEGQALHAQDGSFVAPQAEAASPLLQEEAAPQMGMGMGMDALYNPGDGPDGANPTGDEDKHTGPKEGQATAGDGRGMEQSLSPCEARVAGVFHEQGFPSSVHGLAGMMNPTLRKSHKDNMSKLLKRGRGAIEEAKARLVSNAVLQRQREMQIFRHPQNTMDLDGCDPELAKHLIDLHFNRQHYAYLLTYRPAIMDSLSRGGNRWANKLLLNAIYYSSTLYSDRPCLQSDPSDKQSVGSRFYRRFKQLLVDEIDKPSIPSAVALLLTSATLISQGHSSAGWNLSGMAYRMVLDLGCHMMLGPDYQDADDSKRGAKLEQDLEREIRKRLYWGAYLTDATQALYLGRPCMLASVAARVPLQLLDTFEELEEWSPYVDPVSPSLTQPRYDSQPAYSISTFLWLARLLHISTKITELYDIRILQLSNDLIFEKRRSIEADLEMWDESLPAHLRSPLERSPVPPPHQITPHTTYHALTILIQRAFLEEGHLRRCSDYAQKKQAEQTCLASALSIQALVRLYRDTFSLRRAPFLLSYAVYSAATVFLHHEGIQRGRFTEQISFFWTCLNELMRGCNFGLKKPLAILQDIVNELRLSTIEGDSSDLMKNLQPSLDDSLLTCFNEQHGPVEPSPHPSGGSSIYNFGLDSFFGPDGSTWDSGYGTVSADTIGFFDEQEDFTSQDTLYGLFAP